MTATIRLTVPGTLRYRGIAVRVVAEAARLVSGSEQRDPEDPLVNDVRHPFDMAVVSAFMEIFNNIAIHAYKRKGSGAESLGSAEARSAAERRADVIEIVLTPSERELVIEVRDHGQAFDIDEVAPLPPDLDEHTLPEGGMGIHIAKTMLDEMTYEPGPPNRWRLCKRLAGAAHVGRS